LRYITQMGGNALHRLICIAMKCIAMKLLHLRSCLSGPALKAIEGVTVCAENYSEIVQTLKNRFHWLQDVVESHVLSVVGLKACADDGDAGLTRPDNELNRHFLELKALVKNENSGLSGFQTLLRITRKKLRSGTVTEWKAFVKDKKDDEITPRSSNESYSDEEEAEILEIREYCFTTAAVRVESGEECSMCGGDHSTDDCPRFLRQPLPERWQCVRRLHLCFVWQRKRYYEESCPKRKPGQARNARRIRARKKGRQEAMVTERGNLLEIFSSSLRTFRTNDDDYWLILIYLTVSFNVNFLLQKGYLKWNSKPSNSFSFGLAFEFNGLRSRVI
ncbi:hypothetical protein T11_17771, partial [Trichinella zimbabwensis]